MANRIIFSSQCPSKLQGYGRLYYQSICNLMHLYNLLKEEQKQCLGLQPSAPPGPGGIHTAHAYWLPIGCLSYMLLFNLTGVDKALQRTKRMCGIIMAVKKLRILSHTSVWWIKDRPCILGYTFMLSSDYYYYQNPCKKEHMKQCSLWKHQWLWEQEGGNKR